MELMYVTIVVLASMIFVLSGMVGYLYWQQTRMLQNVQSLASVVSTHFTRQHEDHAEHNQYEPDESDHEAEAEAEAEVNVPELPSDEDDRVSVEHVDGPPKTHVDIDDIQTKTAVQLREILSAKGIPYGKRDSKTVLIQLLKATA